MIRIKCEKCGKILKAPVEAAGGRGRCQACGEVFDVEEKRKKTEDEIKKILGKMEINEPDFRKEYEALLEKTGYNACPYIKRIYDFVRMGTDSKNVAVQCFYKGTIHNPKELCLGDYEKCEKYQEIKKGEDLLNNSR